MTIVSERSVFRPGLLLLVAGALVGARLALGWWAWEPGWTALTWDDFTRVALAKEWAADPVAVPDLVWLPLHTWVLGGAFAIAGGLFTESPMALAAIIHTIALIAASAVVGRTGYEVSGSKGGGLLAFSALLFSPWGFYLSLSGLGETLYYLTVAVAVYGMVRWIKHRSDAGLLVASLGIAIGCALRYEGWWLAVAWAAVLLVGEVRARGFQGISGRVWLAALAPFVVPALWMTVSFYMTGSPVFFATESARYFQEAYGSLDSIRARLLYYPLSLIGSAPLLAPSLLVLVVINRTNPVVRRLVLVTALHFVLFYSTSLVSSAVGAFNERFMFAFVVALLPILATLPAVVRGLSEGWNRRVVTAGLLVLAVTITTFRLADRPTEWTHSPDLLTLVEELGEAAVPLDRPLAVVIDSRLAAVESTPLRTAYGDLLRIAVADTIGVSGPQDLQPDWDVYVARFPDPAAPVGDLPDIMVGRFGVWGPGAATLDLNLAPCPCTRWQLTDESGHSRELRPGPFAWLEFTTDDPLPGSSAVLSTTLQVAADSTEGVVEVRSTYGHGFNPGRIRVEIRVAGETIESWDLAEPSSWRRARFATPDGATTLDLEIAVVASPDIEPDWAWGRASTVLVRSVEVHP